MIGARSVFARVLVLAQVVSLVLASPFPVFAADPVATASAPAASCPVTIYREYLRTKDAAATGLAPESIAPTHPTQVDAAAALGQPVLTVEQRVAIALVNQGTVKIKERSQILRMAQINKAQERVLARAQIVGRNVPGGGGAPVVPVPALDQGGFHLLFIRDILEPVLREGGKRGNVTLTRTATTVTVQSRAGRYVFGLSTSVPAESLGRLIANLELSDSGQISGTIGIHPDWLATNVVQANQRALRGLVRSAFRADEYIHPHIMSPEQRVRAARAVLSMIQRDTHRNLVNMLQRSRVDDRGRALRIGLQGPGGIGKTTQSAHFIASAIRPEVTVFVVNDTAILDTTVATYCRELGLDPAVHVLRLYGNRTRAVIGPNVRLILTTRETAFRRFDDILAAIGARKGVFVWDEAHHVSEDPDGQFQQMVERVNGIPQNPDDPMLHMIYMSATLYRNDANIILHTDHLGFRTRLPDDIPRGKVVAPFLSTVPNPPQIAELEALQRGGVPGLALAELSRIQLLQAMYEGYLTPIHKADIVRTTTVDSGTTAIDLLERNPPQAGGGRVRAIPQELLDQLAEQIRQTRDSNVTDRTVIVVNGTTRADLVRDGLRVLFQQEAARGEVEFRTLHSQPTSDRDVLPWIRDEGTFATAAERRKHKYMIVDKMVNEGVDIPTLNSVIIFRRYDPTDAASIRGLIQIITRASRISGRKLRLRVSDYSEALTALAAHLDIAIVRMQPRQSLGGGGTPPRATAVNRPIDVEIDTATFIEGQPDVTLSEDEIFAWLVQMAPFEDRDAEGISQLALQLWRLVSSIPKRMVTTTGMQPYQILDEEAIGRIRVKSPTLGQALQARSHDIFSAYQAMKDQYDTFVTDLATSDVPDGVTGDVFYSQVAARYREAVGRLWFALKDAIRLFDPFRGKQVTLSLVPRSRVKDLEGLTTMAAFYETSIGRLASSVRHPWEAVLGRADLAIDIEARESEERNGLEIHLSGPNAYSYFARELGYHKVSAPDVKDSGIRNRFVLVKATPALSAQDPQLAEIRREHAAVAAPGNDAPASRRKYDGRDRVIVDDQGAEQVRVNLHRPFLDGANRIEIIDADWPKVALLLRRNQEMYFAALIENKVLPILATQP